MSYNCSDALSYSLVEAVVKFSHKEGGYPGVQYMTFLADWHVANGMFSNSHPQCSGIQDKFIKKFIEEQIYFSSVLELVFHFSNGSFHNGGGISSRSS